MQEFLLWVLALATIGSVMAAVWAACYVVDGCVAVAAFVIDFMSLRAVCRRQAEEFLAKKEKEMQCSYNHPCGDCEYCNFGQS